MYFASSTTGLGIVAPVLDRLRLFGDADHASVRWIGYERYDAPSRAVRLALERRVREAYAAAGDRERAIRSYRRAVERDPGNTHAVRMIRRLQQDQPHR